MEQNETQTTVVRKRKKKGIHSFTCDDAVWCNALRYALSQRPTRSLSSIIEEYLSSLPALSAGQDGTGL